MQGTEKKQKSIHHREIISEIIGKKNFNRIKKIQLSNNRIIETPIVWYGLSIVESISFQLEVFKKCKINAILSNAYDLLVQDKKKKRHDIIKKLQEVGLFHKMDSGGFQLMKYTMNHKKIPVELTPESVYNIQKKIGCDVAVQLDCPFSPFLTGFERNELNHKTFLNFKELLSYNKNQSENITIMPVVHGYSTQEIESCVLKIEKILGEIKIIGIGSLVPMVKSIKGTNLIGGKWTFIEMLIYLRKRLPNTIIHAFGIGGTMSYLAFYCGIDSLDSNGWIQKAAYGVIQLPGISDRFITKKAHGRPYLKDGRIYKRNGKKFILNEKKIFLNCKCPICEPYSNYLDKDKAWMEKVKIFETEGSEGRKIRSIHNVYVFEQELKLIKKAIKSDKLDEFIEARLIKSNYYELYKYAKCLKEGDSKKAEHIRGYKEKFKKIDDFF